MLTPEKQAARDILAFLETGTHRTSPDYVNGIAEIILGHLPAIIGAPDLIAKRTPERPRAIPGEITRFAGTTTYESSKPMGKRIVTTDVEIIDAVIKSFEALDDEYGSIFRQMAPQEGINEAARNVVHILTRPPEKTSDITGFAEDDDTELNDRRA